MTEDRFKTLCKNMWGTDITTLVPKAYKTQQEREKAYQWLLSEECYRIIQFITSPSPVSKTEGFHD